MSELTRRIVARLRHFVGNRRRAKRVYVPLKFTLAIAARKMNLSSSRKLPSLDGHTLDISATGIALIVSAIRIGEHYLTGEDRRLQLIMELPGGPVEMLVAPVRYEGLEEDQGESGYLIGVRIMEMNEADRGQFNEYLGKLVGKQKTERIKT
jgi:c-di-GMP-binding flagellar brake protein YcgR